MPKVGAAEKVNAHFGIIWSSLFASIFFSINMDIGCPRIAPIDDPMHENNIVWVSEDISSFIKNIQRKFETMTSKE
jgi:hypothetical protein